MTAMPTPGRPPLAAAPRRHDTDRPGQAMEILPLFVAGFIIGLQLAGFLPPWSAWLSLTFALGGAAISLLVPIRGAEAWLPLLGCAIACGTFAGAARPISDVDPAALAPFHGASGRLTGVCAGEFRPLARGGLSFTLEAAVFETASQSIALPGGIRIETRRSALLPEPGQRYTATGSLSVGEDRRRPARFRTPEIVEASGAALLAPNIGYVQRLTRDAVSRLLPERHQGFVQGLLLGDTSRLSRDDRRLFRDTGVSHLLAVSGQHLLVLALVLTAMLRWSGTPPLSRALLTVGVLMLYALLTSGQPSVWRAVVMYVAVAVASLFEADPGPVRPLAAAALVLLLWEPAWVHHVGFQLSFLAVLGIVLGRPPLESLLMRLRLPRLLARYLAVSTAASLVTMPLAAWHFGMVPLAAFIVNPLVVWSFDFILPIALLTVILSAVSFKAALFLAAGLSLALDGFMAVVETGATLPMAVVDVGGVPATLVAAVYAGFLGAAAWWNRQASHAGADLPASPRSQTPVAQVPSAPPPPSRKPAPPAVPARNPLKSDSLVDAIDAQLAVFPKRALKQAHAQIEAVTFPVQALGPESQNIFHRIDDLTLETLRGQPDRLIEAQVYGLALLGNELLARIAVRLEPPPTPEDIRVRKTVKNRYLALAMATEAFFDSPLPGRPTRAALAPLIQQAYDLHQEGCRLLELFIRAREEEGRLSHMEYRQKLFGWCRALIDAIAADEKRRKAPIRPGESHERE